MGNLNQSMYDEKSLCCVKRLSWSAVFAGALVGVGIAFLFHLFGVAIGLAAFVHATGPKTLAIGGFIGLIIATMFSMGTAGYVAGFLGRPKCLKHNMGVLYGFIAWVLALIITILLSSHMGKFIYYNTNSLSGPGTMMSQAQALPQSPVLNSQATPTTMQTGNVVFTSDAKPVELTTFIAFVLFFIGALSACIGGHCGFKACNDEIIVERERIVPPSA